MKNQLMISLYCGVSARRAALCNLTRKSFKDVTVRLANNIESFRPLGDAPAETLIADLGTASEVLSLIQRLNELPEAFGAVALMDAPEPRSVGAVLAAGVNAILSREPTSEELRLAIAAAEAGFVLLHPSSARNLAIENFRPSIRAGDVEELTAREREVLRLLGDGLGNKQIAARLEISEHTAKFHISSILGKMNAASRTEAVSQGIKKGLIPI